MNLTTEEQRTLTEWLGECFHDRGGWFNADASKQTCIKCGGEYTRGSEGLDFSDWRVIGRGIKKLIAAGERGAEFECGSFGEYRCIIHKGDTYGALSFGPDSPDEEAAFWTAVLAHLEEKK